MFHEEIEGPRRSPRGEASSIRDVVDELCAANEAMTRGARRQDRRQPLPSRWAIEGIVEDLRTALFPTHFGRSDLGAAGMRHLVSTCLERARQGLAEQTRCGLDFACNHPVPPASSCPSCDRRAREVAEALIASLPRLRALLEADARAAYEGDPAARFFDETLFCYPGITAITQHRIAHELYRHGVPLVPRIIAELAHSTTGIDIHPAAQIGSSFFVDHGTGVVIGETCTIGERVRIYQGVTLGARGFSTDDEGRLVKSLPRHPIVEDDVVIYAGATILGRISIGRGSTIGGNVWLTRSVPPGSQVSQAQPRHQSFQNGSGI
jgi:serine O-acetyltransferase